MRAPALLLAVALLAGCAAEPPAPPEQGPDPAPGAPGGPSTPFDLANGSSLRLPLPLWSRGHAWTWEVTSSEGGGGTQTWVVVDDQASDYLLAATDRDAAVAQAFHGRTMPGPVNRQHLSGYEEGRPTHYLDFPLEENRTWTLSIRETDFPVRAQFMGDVDQRGPGFLVRGAGPAGETVSLGYVPAVKWMTHFHLVQPGQREFLRVLTAFEPSYQGPYYRAAATELYQGVRNGTQPAAPADTFAQPGEATLLHLALTVAGSGTVSVRLVDPAGGSHLNYTTTGTDLADLQERDLPSAPGTWAVLWQVAGPVEARLQVASLQVEEGVL